MGAEFTSQCDVRIASTRARFGWVFVHRGLVPDTGAGTWLLPRLVGPTAALRLLFSGDFITADEALRIGYVSEVVEPDALPDAARAEAERFLRGLTPRHRPDQAARSTRASSGPPTSTWRAHREALAACFRSDDHREGVAAFLERRDAELHRPLRRRRGRRPADGGDQGQSMRAATSATATPRSALADTGTKPPSPRAHQRRRRVAGSATTSS